MTVSGVGLDAGLLAEGFGEGLEVDVFDREAGDGGGGDRGFPGLGFANHYEANRFQGVQSERHSITHGSAQKRHISTFVEGEGGFDWRLPLAQPPDRKRVMLSRPGGLEPPTSGLGNRCSILLSYGRSKLVTPYIPIATRFASSE